ncbi:thioredoxin [candidate division WWE3 bacterium RIFCSPLOWO2_12_FULL_36_10]|uniref:Thioredoxin n=1 Tax=candidate division WWE3 bacterium RIFCSPLOWO2_12_FULL_36_10 TaxID=1802630 RepID=A0A1F4VJ85_UNCKA|nr:MAG: thioredoxin [candidate division WWE3 bacterium RIFCSPLOWO2_12_FULL_36_10]
MLWYHINMIMLLDFYADWCGPCKAMEPIFAEVEKEYVQKVEFKKIDVEVEGAVASQYGVQGIPTYILVKDGKEVSRKIGAMPKAVLTSWISSNL